MDLLSKMVKNLEVDQILNESLKLRLLTDEERAAIKDEIPMTQELFEQCTAHCVEIDAMFLLTSLLNEYPEFADVYAGKEEEAAAHIDLPEETPEQLEKRWQELCARIRERYGEDVI